jgi:hypothetical protein
MSRFTAPLIVTPTEDYRRWRIVQSNYASYLVSDSEASLLAYPKLSGDANVDDELTGEVIWQALIFSYDLGSEGSGVSVTPPYLFETDFANIPWFARWLFKTWDRWTNAAVIHDYLYAGGTIEGYAGKPNYHPTRKEADDIFLEGMVVMNVSKWQRLLLYAGVRAGGWRTWKKHRQ